MSFLERLDICNSSHPDHLRTKSPLICANYSDQTTGWSTQMVLIVRESSPKCQKNQLFFWGIIGTFAQMVGKPNELFVDFTVILGDFYPIIDVWLAWKPFC